ncbi:MAG: hypothetical protein NWR43_02790, partial [Alphaproteobacteria bacterium]|nr:hypothetical protein [Alphaproteobacteria bacterium]
MNITNPPLDPHPRYADSLVGHAPVVEHLKAAHKAGRLPHGLLFTGEKGLGKATLAHQLARALLTDSMEYLGEKRPLTLTSTDHLLRAGNHPDFIVLEKAADE